MKRLLLVLAFAKMILILMACSIFIINCRSEAKTPKTKTGVLIGVKASFDLNDATDGNIKKMDFKGIVVLKLEDEAKAYAYCEENLWSKLRGGMKLEIAKIENSEKWKVLRIINDESD